MEIIDKKMFTKTSQGYGFAPVLTEHGWSLCLFDSRDDYENNIVNTNFVLQDPELTLWSEYWQVASALKSIIANINNDVSNWMNPPKPQEGVNLVGGLGNPYGWKLD